MQLLALSFALFVPTILFSCVNQIPGHDDELSITRQQVDTTAQDTIDGFDGKINEWNDGGEIGTDTIYRIN